MFSPASAQYEHDAYENEAYAEIMKKRAQQWKKEMDSGATKLSFAEWHYERFEKQANQYHEKDL